MLPGGQIVTPKPGWHIYSQKDNVTLTIGKRRQPTHYNFTDAQGHKIDSDINPDGSLMDTKDCQSLRITVTIDHDYREYGLNLQTGQLN